MMMNLIPLLTWETTIFPQMLFAFCLGFATMFVLAVDDCK